MAGLPPAARLRRAGDFAALKSAAGRLQTRHFALRWMAGSSGSCRLGMAVSRKVSKRAVERNRIKRVIRESFRAERETLPTFDILSSRVLRRQPSPAVPCAPTFNGRGSS
jgi:ribonuclease P protein component